MRHVQDSTRRCAARTYRSRSRAAVVSAAPTKWCSKAIHKSNSPADRSAASDSNGVVRIRTSIVSNSSAGNAATCPTGSTVAIFFIIAPHAALGITQIIK
jgi:hypothetical protein